ncbi:hypothetical protein ED733_002608 [Metarhizium rileyi]|uniref:Uncharacterized protein n=1 Tax=Metarhizium rileyi (strain RCEF 4871) TaxID=1649241 RepID=A0A5C6G7T7_METRR|nr:hypothetical protein ED733_002608 [Metarhizium rileyi]
MAARKYRQKRLDRISDLESALGDVTSERDELKLQLARREAEVEALREMLSRKSDQIRSDQTRPDERVVLQDWEICVPTELVSKAVQLLESPPQSDVYVRIDPIRCAQVHSMIHTYDRFQSRGIWHIFVIVPSFDVHLDCRPANIVRSLRGLPYPDLKVFAQSCLDRRNVVELCDLIDGTDVSEEWGEENLDLEGTHDVEWASAMRRRTTEWDVEKEGKPRPIDFWPTRPKSKRIIWQSLDWSRPPSIFFTQYRVHGSPDPWTVLSDVS